MAIHFLKQYDTEPPFDAQLVNSAGAAIDLTGSTVTASMSHSHESRYRFQDQAVLIIGDPTLGNVQYIVQTGDGDVAGLHYLHWRVTFPTGRIETFPQLHFDVVHIDAALVLA